MNKNKWIEDVLESTKQVQEVEPNPFLFEKITQRIEQGKIDAVNLKGAKGNVKWAFSVVIAIIITVNGFGIAKSLQNRATTTSVSHNQLGSDMNEDLGYTTIYSY